MQAGAFSCPKAGGRNAKFAGYRETIQGDTAPSPESRKEARSEKRQARGCDLMKKIQTERIVEFKKSDEKKQIVYGEVYVPGKKDSDGNWMTAETIEKMAHDFLRRGHVDRISKGHDGQCDKGEIVESFIVREGDPDYAEGSWVVGVHIPDAKIWKQVEDGILTGFSIEGSGVLIEETEE
jgi:hypothetical protein